MTDVIPPELIAQLGLECETPQQREAQQRVREALEAGRNDVREEAAAFDRALNIGPWHRGEVTAAS